MACRIFSNVVKMKKALDKLYFFVTISTVVAENTFGTLGQKSGRYNINLV